MCNLSDGVFEDGVKKGTAQTVRRVAASLIKSGYPDEMIAEHFELSLEEVRKLRQELALA